MDAARGGQTAKGRRSVLWHRMTLHPAPAVVAQRVSRLPTIRGETPRQQVGVGTTGRDCLVPRTYKALVTRGASARTGSGPGPGSCLGDITWSICGWAKGRWSQHQSYLGIFCRCRVRVLKVQFNTSSCGFQALDFETLRRAPHPGSAPSPPGPVRLPGRLSGPRAFLCSPIFSVPQGQVRAATCPATSPPWDGAVSTEGQPESVGLGTRTCVFKSQFC